MNKLPLCKECGSDKVKDFKGELAVHFPGREGLTKPFVLVLTRLDICRICGWTNFTVPRDQLRLLVKGLGSLDAVAGDTVHH